MNNIIQEIENEIKRKTAINNFLKKKQIQEKIRNKKIKKEIEKQIEIEIKKISLYSATRSRELFNKYLYENLEKKEKESYLRFLIRNLNK